MTIIPGPTTSASAGPELVSITGTAFARIPLPGRPECSGLLVDDEHPPVARVEDGALVIDVPDIDTAIAWRDAFQQAASHLILHQERTKERHTDRLTDTESEV